jgi:hypothetical protein
MKRRIGFVIRPASNVGCAGRRLRIAWRALSQGPRPGETAIRATARDCWPRDEAGAYFTARSETLFTPYFRVAPWALSEMKR